jgi:YVTN family beta-propeller protein
MSYSIFGVVAALSTAAIASAATTVPATPPVLGWAPAATVFIPNSTGKFDFLRIDPKRYRLLAAHEKDGTSDFIDLRTKTVLARVAVGAAVDTAWDADSKLYFVSVQEGERIAVLDAATLKEINTVKLPGPSDAIIYEPKDHLLYVTHDDGNDVWVVNPKSLKVIATIAVPGVPEFMDYDSSTDRIYLNIKNKDVVAVIDPNSSRVIGLWPTAPATLPHGLAIDSKGHRIFSAGGNGKLVSIDTRTGTVTDSIDIAPKVDQIAMDLSAGLLYCAAADKMSVVRTNGRKLQSLGALPTSGTAKNVAVDPLTHEVWTTFTDGKSSYAKSWKVPLP